MQYVYLILMILLIGVLIKYINHLNKKGTRSVELSEEDIKVFHIFPDYPKSVPYECRAGEEFHFIVRGYTDKYQLKEVPINGDKVVWDYTKGNGEFKGNRNIQTGEYTGNSIDFITPKKLDIYTKERLIFVSAHYGKFTDATWIKVIN